MTGTGRMQKKGGGFLKVVGKCPSFFECIFCHTCFFTCPEEVVTSSFRFNTGWKDECGTFSLLGGPCPWGLLVARGGRI
jgi:hypothetical protein